MKTLWIYEMKKIWQRRMVWICLVFSIMLALITVGGPLLGSYYVKGEKLGSNYEIFLQDKAYQKALDGRAIDDMLLSEMQEAYSNVSFEDEKYSLTEAYQKYARPYSAIYHYVRQVTGLAGVELVAWQGGAADLQRMRLMKMEKRWEELLLSDREKDYWRAAEARLEEPMVFRYAEGYSVLFSAAYTIGALVLFIVAICLSGVFPQEHGRKTDQMILCCKWGRGKLYMAKCGAGILSALGMSASLVLTAVIVALVLYGTEGYDAAFQQIYVGNSHSLTVGEAVLITYLMILLAGVFMGALVMMFSEIFHSSMGALSIAIGIILLPMFFSMPEEYRLLSQLWSYLPGDFVAGWSCFSMQTVVIAGKVFLPWQVVPVLYMMLGLLFAWVTGRRFLNYQVSGR